VKGTRADPTDFLIGVVLTVVVLILCGFLIFSR
jgi:hypothetical protein